MNELLVLETQRALETLSYPTPLAIAKEIVDFTNGNERKIKKIIQRLSKNQPWEQIRGYTFFKKNKIYLNQNVLIPRVETEELVDIALEEIKKHQNDFQIFDVGTGSGCISIALSKHLENKIIAIDISKKALKIAKKNIKENKAKNIELKNANLLNFEFDNKKPTIIIANLPYIPSNQIVGLDDSVKNYEPKIALDGGTKGTKFYLELMDQIKQKEINLQYAIFEIMEENIDDLKKYNGIFHKDSFNKTRFFSISPSPQV